MINSLESMDRYLKKCVDCRATSYANKRRTKDAKMNATKVEVSSQVFVVYFL